MVATRLRPGRPRVRPSPTGAGRAQAFFRLVLRTLQEAGAPFLVGGSFALAHYTGIKRQTRDLDLMIQRADWPIVARVLRAEGITRGCRFPTGSARPAPTARRWISSTTPATARRRSIAPGSRVPFRRGCSASTWRCAARRPALVEGVRDGAGTLRRRRRHPSPSCVGGPAGLAAPVRSLSGS